MTTKNHSNRALAYTKAQQINLEDLEKISGGASSGMGTTRFTTKQTFNTHGSWDVGGDVQWD